MTPKKLSELFAGQCLLLHEARSGRQLLCTECCEGALRAAQNEAIERCATVAEASTIGIGPGATKVDAAYADGWQKAADTIAADLRALKEEG